MYRSILFAFSVCMGVAAHSRPSTPSLRSVCGEKGGDIKRSQRIKRRDTAGDYVIHSEAPVYDHIKNETCLLTPETSDGPYFYPSSQLLRQNIRESEPGVPLELEIGVVDVNTCEPMADVLVDIWHCNATGSYSAFTGIDPNTQFGTYYRNLTGEDTPDFSKGMSNLTWLHTDNSTFLRGMWPTNKNGITSFQSIFPGFYIQRTIHIHVQVHTNWTVHENATLSHGPIVSNGQIFMDEALEEHIMSMEPYAQHTEIERYTNDIDGIYSQESSTGAMTILDTEPLDGKDYANGVLGYITLGIDPTTINNGSTIDASPPVFNLTSLQD